VSFHPALTAALGDDLVFELAGLLTEQSSTNLRNLFAHGLLDDGDFFTPETTFLWLCTLRLLVVVTKSDAGDELAQPPEPGPAL
jgi:hypothetical protein